MFALSLPPNPLRSSPSAAAGSPAEGWYHKLRIAIALVLLLPVLPLYVFWWIIARPANLPLKQYLLTRVVQGAGGLVAMLPPVPSSGYDEAIGDRKLDAWEGINVELISVPPPSPSLCGALAEGPTGVVPVSRPGFILTPPGSLGKATEPAKQGEQLVLYIHGGAYVLGHPFMSTFPLKIAKGHAVRVLAASYRKCLSDDTSFPAPLLDALGTWQYATQFLGFSPGQICLMGDSAGGHLSFILALQLAALGRACPGGMALCSPWADITMSFPSWKTNARTDLLPQRLIKTCAASVLRHYTPEAARSVLFAPALAGEGTYRSLVNCAVFISYGLAEVFCDEDAALVKALQRDGVDVSSFAIKDGIHCSPLSDFSPPEQYKRFSDGIADVLTDMRQKAKGM